MKRWWSRRECIERELRRLEDKAFRFTPPETIPDHGPVSLRVWVEIDGNEHEVEVVFPDLFPYFRFEVFAPSLDLSLHQNRLEKNLCLLGRGAAFRPKSDSVAEFLGLRLQNLIQSVRTESLEEAADLEDHQAEPETAYYPYSRPGVVLVAGSWEIPADLSHGYVELGTNQSSAPFDRLAVLELKAPDGTVLGKLPTEVARLFRRVGQGSWVWRESHLFEKDPAEYFRRVQAEDSGSPPRIRRDGVDQRLYLVAAPEQGSWRGRESTGWVAVTEIRRTRSQPKYAFLQAARIGRDDLELRVPELAPLREKTVAVVGLGSLGAPAALALAQAGIGELRLIDQDWIDPGASVRWPLGISEAGDIKTYSIAHFISRNYPYTRVPRFPNELQQVLQDVAPAVARDASPYPHPHDVGGNANPRDFDLLGVCAAETTQ